MKRKWKVIWIMLMVTMLLFTSYSITQMSYLEVKAANETNIKPVKKKPYKKYHPKKVAKLANQYTKKVKGMVYIPTLLKLKLKKGEITKKEYKKYYPTAGTGYYEIYINQNLNEAYSAGGKRLKSEKAIAKYIRGLYKYRSEKYFYVEYKGKKKVKGKKCYVFRCYRG